MRTEDGTRVCNQCRMVIAPMEPQIRADERDFHFPACYRLYNLKKRMEERQSKVREITYGKRR